MASCAVVVDPLFERLEFLVRDGRPHALERARTLFGSQRELDALLQKIRDSCRHAGPSGNVIVDLTPFPSLGAEKRVATFLDASRDLKFMAVVRSSVAYDLLKDASHIASVLLDDESYKPKEAVFPGPARNRLRTFYKTNMEPLDFIAFRRALAEAELLAMSAQFVRRPPPGARYVQLHDRAWANQWIDVKAILREPRKGFYLAYLMGYLLTRGYTADLDEDSLIVTNNIAYVLAVYLARIIENRPLVMIDRLGPFPRLTPMRVDAIENLRQKRFCLVEDVVSTGREVDMAALLAVLRDAEIRRAVCVFDLEVARPRLVPSSSLISLCRPSRKLRWRQVPAYARESSG